MTASAAGGDARAGRPTGRIVSPRNRRVVAAVALHRRRPRTEQGRYLVEGIRAVRTTLEAGDVEELFATTQGLAALDAVPLPPTVRVVADDVLRRLATSVTPQGVAAVARQRRSELASVLGQGFALVLCAAADPGNVGAVVRIADAAGAAGVILTRGSADPWNPKAARAAAGSLCHVPVVVDATVDEVVAACRAIGQRVVALDARGESDVAAPGVLAPPVAILAGSEAHGLPAGLTVDAIAAIPVFGRAESLNLAAAIAVAAYAAARAGRTGADPAGDQTESAPSG